MKIDLEFYGFVERGLRRTAEKPQTLTVDPLPGVPPYQQFSVGAIYEVSYIEYSYDDRDDHQVRAPFRVISVGWRFNLEAPTTGEAARYVVQLERVDAPA